MPVRAPRRSCSLFASTPSVLIALAASALVAGCGGDEDDAGAGDGGLEGAGGLGGGGESGPANCAPPAGATVLLDWGPRSGGDGAPVYKLTVDGDHLYVQGLDRIERVPLAGGAPETVFVNRADIPITTNGWLRNDDKLLVVDDEGAALVPKTGGEATALTLPETVWLGGLFGQGNPYDRETDTIYGARYSSESGTQLTTLFAISVATAEETILAQDIEMETPSNFDFDGGTFAYQPKDTEGSLQVTRDHGMTWQTAAFTAPPGTELRFAGLTEGRAIFVASNFDPPFSGLASGPVDGGELSLLVDNFVLSRRLAHGLGVVAVNDADELIVARLDGGPAKVIPLAVGADCTSHGIALDDAHVYSSFYRASTGESLLFAVPR